MSRKRKDTRSPGPPSKAELGLYIERIRELVEKDPRKAAIVLTEWMNRASPGAVKKEEKKKAG